MIAMISISHSITGIGPKLSVWDLGQLMDTLFQLMGGICMGDLCVHIFVGAAHLVCIARVRTMFEQPQGIKVKDWERYHTS